MGSHMLTDEQKQACLIIAMEFSASFHREETFLKRIVAIDKIWTIHSEPELKSPSSVVT